MDVLVGSRLRIVAWVVSEVTRRAREQTRGSTAAEYALLLGLLVVVLVISISMLGGAISSLFQSYPQLISS